MNRNQRVTPRSSGRMRRQSAPQDGATRPARALSRSGAHAPQTSAMAAPRPALGQALIPFEIPLSVRYHNQNATAYQVLDMRNQQILRVPKHRTRVEAFPPHRAQRPADMRVLHWSSVALLGVVLGGVPAIVCGLLTALVAEVLLLRLGSRALVWRQVRRAAPGAIGLPSRASLESARLRTAFWQSLLAVALGMVVVLVLLGLLP